MWVWLPKKLHLVGIKKQTTQQLKTVTINYNLFFCLLHASANSVLSVGHTYLFPVTFKWKQIDTINPLRCPHPLE